MKWQAEKSLGRRGPFDVWAAWPVGTAVQQAVLLQRLAVGVQVHPGQLQAYLQEQRALAAHPHPNRLRILEAGTSQGRLYIVSEYPHGRSLAAVLGRLANRGLPGQLLLGLLEHVAAALHAAHCLTVEGRPLVHGFLGPGQVILGFDGKVKVRDFGLYRLLGADAERGGALLAPEQRRGGQPDQRSDVFALGRLTQELLLLAPAVEPPVGLSPLLQAMTERDPRRRPAGLDPFREVLRAGGLEEEQLRQELAGWLRESEPADTAGKAAPAGEDDDLLDPAAFWQGAPEVAGAEEQDGGAEQPTPPAAERASRSEAFAPEHLTPGSGLPPAPAPGAVPAGANGVEPAAGVPRPTPTARPPTAGGLPPPGPATSRGGDRPGAERRGRPLDRPAPARPGWGRKNTVLMALLVLAMLAGAVTALLAYQPEQSPPPAPRRQQATTATRKEPHREVGVAAVEPRRQAPRAPLTGQLTIESDPPGAVVYLDGRKQGVTPTVVRHLELEREVAVRLELDDFRPWETRLRPSAGRPRLEVRAELFPLEDCRGGRGWLYVISEPVGAVVEIDGHRFPGATPLIISDLCAGRGYKVTVRAPGFRPWREEQLFIPAKRVRNLRVRLER